MKTYGIIEVVESLKMNAGETLSESNLVQEELLQTAMNESLQDDEPRFDSLDKAREELKKYHASGRVDMVKVGKHRYWEVALTTYQVTELFVDDAGDIMDWGDVWDITPFRVEIDDDGKVDASWG